MKLDGAPFVNSEFQIVSREGNLPQEPTSRTSRELSIPTAVPHALLGVLNALVERQPLPISRAGCKRGKSQKSCSVNSHL